MDPNEYLREMWREYPPRRDVDVPEVKVLHVLKKRPERYASGLLFNAPRPIYCNEPDEWWFDRDDERGLGFLHGRFYAIVRTDGEYPEEASSAVLRNVANDAYVIQFHTEEEAIRDTVEYYTSRYGKEIDMTTYDLDDPKVKRQFTQSFLNRRNSGQ